ncbi:MAG TPA: glycoside hydrolase family 2 TIM barrel-domain containing protein, partial [Phycisphaerae bacterium]|nr:glycoside hydrolase family 2 TIM barrel-domain containing protein [Phycisphaerae bacterium]
EKKAEADAWGAKLSTAGNAPAGWYPATVPGTVLTTLVNNKVYPEPLFGENNRPDKIPDSLCRTSYWYRAQATIPADYAGKHIWLNFDGINYTADIWVNGAGVGGIKGAFARGIFDITDRVKPGEKVAIAVRINPPPHPGIPQEQTVANGTGPNGGALMQDGPTFGCTVGWDWIPGIRDRDMGIWQKVTLSATGPVRVDDPSVSSDLPLPRTDTADLMVLATVTNATDRAQTGTLRGTFDGGSFAFPVTLQPKEVKEVKVTPADAPGLHINNPRLWWPNTYGEPHLYAMHVTFDTDAGMSDARDVNFGIRKITYAVPAEESRIPPTENLTLFVNGVPVFCKGGCWGMDEAMKRIPRERLETQIRFHALANYTMIRNWVGQSTSEDFYDLCDKYGILVWDEMFQANQSDGPQVGGIPTPDDTPEILQWRLDTIDMYLANVREKVLRFRSHPSIALWCGRNESYPAPRAVADGLTKLTAELDPARFYQANSGDGRGVRSGGPYSWRPPAAYFGPVGQADGRGGILGFARGALEPFKTELGSVSIPTLAAIKAMLDEKDWYDLNDAWAAHDLCSGAQAGNTFPASMSARYGAIAPRDLKDFVRKSQMAMYETYRAMYEGRQARLFNPCSAVLTWMSNPSQPSFVWQLYSYDLEPLAALYGTRKACEPLHIQLNQHDWHIMVINTQPQAKNDLQATIRLFDMAGTLKGEQTLPVNARPCGAMDLGQPAWPDGLTPVHFVKLELKDAGGKLISENFYWRTTATLAPGAAPDPATVFGAGGIGRAGRGRGTGAVAGANEDFSALQSMPTAEVTVAAKVLEESSHTRYLATITVTNSTKIPALQVHLQLRHSTTGQRILPAFYSDNFFSLLPGESKAVEIEAPQNAAGAEAPEVAIDGWNVGLARDSVGGAMVKIALNKDAFVAPK